MKRLAVIIISWCIIALPLHAQNEINLPDMGASSSIELTPHMEEQIGREIAVQIRNSHQLIDDLEINEYLNNLGYSLVVNSDDVYQSFHFFLIKSTQINAFATPGGVIAVYSGLFLTTENESELASVIGHEIAHVSQRHIARSFEKANQLSLPVLAGMVTGILLGAATGSGDIGAATAIGLSAAGQQAQINNIRANEEEADSVGMRYLAKSGYDPFGMPEFFQKLERKNRYAGTAYPEFLRTHPVTINRIAASSQRAAQYRKEIKNFKKADNYRLMKVRLDVLTTSDNKSSTQYYADKIAKASIVQYPEYYYGYGLSLYQGQKYTDAAKIFHTLYEQNPDNTSYIVALAKSFIAVNQKEEQEKGLELLDKSVKNKPYDLILTVNYANELIQTDHLNKSIEILTSFNKENFKHPEIYKLLSRALGKQNKLTEAHQAEAEYYYLNGMLEQAIMQIKIAIRTAPKNDFYLHSRLTARKKAFEEEQEKYKIEE